MFKIKHIHFVVAVLYAAFSSHAWSPINTYGGRLFPARREQWHRRQPRTYPPWLKQREFPIAKMISEQQLGRFEIIETTQSPSERKVALLDYTTEITPNTSQSSLLIDFDTAWGHQRQILEEQMERLSLMKGKGKNSNDHGNISSFLPTMDNGDETLNSGHRDTIIMLQHKPVYTLGTGSDERFVKSISSSNDSTDDSTNQLITSVPVIRMDRGGEVTYHGPGQITVYPVLDLRSYRQDIHWYMRALEEAIILAISKCATNNKELRAEREDGITGVWIDNHKVAAVGIKCRRWITQHGLAVNVEESSLSNFQGIVPCGLEGRKVGCLNQFLIEQGDEPITVPEFAVLIKEALEEILRIELVNQPLMF